MKMFAGMLLIAALAGSGIEVRILDWYYKS